MKATRLNNSNITALYQVEGITFETDEQILDFCDCCNFGGVVSRFDNGQASVKVYID